MTDSSEDSRRLVLTRLGEGWPKLSAAMGQVMAECASVCLHERGHKDEVPIYVIGDHPCQYTIRYLEVTDQIRDTYNDLEEATEWGACGVAILLICDLTEHTVVERAAKKGGFDYWLGYKEDPLFQKRARLEVSGILVGNDSTIKSRVKQKRKQTNPSDHLGLQAYIVVVEFGKPTAQVETK